MNNKVLQADLTLFLTALIWGFAFVAQKEGMEHIGPFTFNAIRFLLGSLALLPFLFLRKDKNPPPRQNKKQVKLWQAGAIAGTALFLGAAFQQTGIKYTTAGNAGFITSLYVIFTPVLGIFLGSFPKMRVWAGALLATAGLYLLTVDDGLDVHSGDFLVLLCAFFYAVHVHVIGWLSPGFNSIRLAFMQFLAAGLLSLLIAPWVETIQLNAIMSAAIPLLYVGILSTAVAFTLQIVGQKVAIPSHAAIILSFEAVFAAIGGWLLLNESFTIKGIFGSLLMLCGIIIAQVKIFRRKRNKKTASH